MSRLPIVVGSQGWMVTYLPAPALELDPTPHICLTIIAQAQPPLAITNIPLQITWIAELQPPPIAAQIATVSLPFTLATRLSDPAICHLVQLLKTELETPQVLSQLCVASLVWILTTHLLQTCGDLPCPSIPTTP